MKFRDSIRHMDMDTGEKRSRLLYPIMLAAAIAVIIFSIVGIATMMGMMPSALSRNAPVTPSEPAANEPAATANDPRSAPGVGSRVECADCGVVESIRPVEVKGQASGLGAVSGGVVGGLLGNQLGGGRGRTALTIVGAGAGAYAGHEVERSMNKSVRYQVRVRMNDGIHRTLYQASPPEFEVGQRVRVRNNHMIAAG